MNLPDAFLDELRSRVSLAQVVGRKVAWDLRKSNQGKGDMWAPCPFHQEKTASFHVDDRKGFYYCFGCHAKGDAIRFTRETENLSFIEAVERLAQEAGLELPERSPASRAKADRRAQLVEVMEQAVRHYRLQLRTAAAGVARDYLARRGLDDAAQERWAVGFAPDARRGVLAHLTAQGVPEQLVVDAGLAARPEDGSAAYDRFRGRIIFPIRDARGQTIALGGRALDPGARAKYLNSPQTEIFDKGRGLYNVGPAREAAGRDQPLIVAEGYMDVIALSEAGFGAAVAPLGTAITEDQLRLLWRIHPEPVVALDGDRAGLRAAMRLIDVALPMLDAGQSLRFCLMPEGRDPDDVVRSEGRTAMRRLIEEAQPMVRLLWRRETEGKFFDSPERKAALDRSLRTAIRRIPDPSLRTHYGQEFAELRKELFGQKRRPPRGRGFRAWSRPPTAAPETRSSLLAASGDAMAEELREAVILATLIAHPSLLPQFEGELERLEMTSDDHRALQAALLAPDVPEHGDIRAYLAGRLGKAPLERLHMTRHVQIAPGVRRGAVDERAALCLAEEFAKLAARRGARRDIDEALRQAENADENLIWRLSRAAEALAGPRRERRQVEDFETAPNGAQVRRDERTALDDLIGEIDFSRGGRRRT
ncbi:DNA primase [Roseitranquillus sediminis]|uniref:DNA primase n=1 Tax=Roseitranquillus sediminis TaxID=2809051 RepID=UPI001D0CAF07|nr:DNA primase [Roseitranquillus sediminis]MBM9593127.1 DNA primase [Roseitranquillus sediminis]